MSPNSGSSRRATLQTKLMGVAVTPIGRFSRKPRLVVRGSAGHTLVDVGIDAIRAAFTGRA